MIKRNKTKKQKRKSNIGRIKSKKSITKKYKYNKRGGQYIVREDTDPPAYKESYDELINK